jgi:phage FluMu protein gp41
MENIQLTSYNIWGQKINEGNIFVDIENEKIITKNGKEFKVVKDYEFTYKIQKTQINAQGGINGLYKFINEINTKDSPFNPALTDLFIDL